MEGIIKMAPPRMAASIQVWDVPPHGAPRSVAGHWVLVGSQVFVTIPGVYDLSAFGALAEKYNMDLELL